MPEGSPSSVSRTIWWLALGRLPATTATRMLAPLLGVIATGLGVSIVDAGVVVAIFELAGLTAPLAGWAVDRLGADRALRVSLAAFAVCALAAGAAPGVVAFAVAMACLGLVTNVYEAASVVWIADRTPFLERSSWMGRYELSWAGGLLVGVPIAAVLSLVSWRLAFVVVGVTCAPVLVVLSAWLRVDARRVAALDETVTVPLASPVETAAASSPARAVAVFAAFGILCGASQVVFVVSGVWLEERFGLGSLAIGGLAFTLGLADLAATRTSLTWTDRLGKRRAAMAGTGLLVLAAVACASLSGRLVPAMVALFVLVGAFEFALLSAKPLLTELGWRRRGVGIGIGFALGAACRGAAAVAGTRLYAWRGFAAAALASAGVAALAWLVFRVGVREPAAIAERGEERSAV